MLIILLLPVLFGGCVHPLERKQLLPVLILGKLHCALETFCSLFSFSGAPILHGQIIQVQRALRLSHLDWSIQQNQELTTPPTCSACDGKKLCDLSADAVFCVLLSGLHRKRLLH